MCWTTIISTAASKARRAAASAVKSSAWTSRSQVFHAGPVKATTRRGVVSKKIFVSSGGAPEPREAPEADDCEDVHRSPPKAVQLTLTLRDPTDRFLACLRLQSFKHSTQVVWKIGQDWSMHMVVCLPVMDHARGGAIGARVV